MSQRYWLDWKPAGGSWLERWGDDEGERERYNRESAEWKKEKREIDRQTDRGGGGSRR